MPPHSKFLRLVFAALVVTVFSTRLDVLAKTKFKRQVECEFNLCNATDGYPSELIAQIASKHHERYSNLFGDVVQPHKQIELINKFNAKEKENMCVVRSMIMFPTKALDIDHNWRTVVNVEAYRQAITFDACINKTDCFAEGKLPLGYRTACEQQYITVRMIILDENEELKLAKFPVPSGCACVYFFDENY